MTFSGGCGIGGRMDEPPRVTDAEFEVIEDPRPVRDPRPWWQRYRFSLTFPGWQLAVLIGVLGLGRLIAQTLFPH